MGKVRACDDCRESTENTCRKAVTDITENVSHVGSTCSRSKHYFNLGAGLGYFDVTVTGETIKLRTETVSLNNYKLGQFTLTEQINRYASKHEENIIIIPGRIP
jgi:hypothetical protein